MSTQSVESSPETPPRGGTFTPADVEGPDSDRSSERPHPDDQDLGGTPFAPGTPGVIDIPQLPIDVPIPFYPQIPPPIRPIDPQPPGANPPSLPSIPLPSGGSFSAVWPSLPNDSTWQHNSVFFSTNAATPLDLKFEVERGAVTFVLCEWNTSGMAIQRWRKTLQAGQCAIVAERSPATESTCRFHQRTGQGLRIWVVRAIGGQLGGDYLVTGNVRMS